MKIRDGTTINTDVPTPVLIYHTHVNEHGCSKWELMIYLVIVNSYK